MRAASSLLSSCFPRSFLPARSRLPGRRGRAAAGGGAEKEGRGGGEEGRGKGENKQTNPTTTLPGGAGGRQTFPRRGRKGDGTDGHRAPRSPQGRRGPGLGGTAAPLPPRSLYVPPQPGSPAPARAQPAIIGRTRPWAELAGEAASTPLSPVAELPHAPSPPSTAAGCSPRLRRHPAPSRSAGGPLRVFPPAAAAPPQPWSRRASGRATWRS